MSTGALAYIFAAQH